jgi:hypothetical protein
MLQAFVEDEANRFLRNESLRLAREAWPFDSTHYQLLTFFKVD